MRTIMADTFIKAISPKLPNIRLGKMRWLIYPLMCTTVITAVLVAVGFLHVYFDRTNLPDIEPFARFEFPAIGCIYDANGRPLIELAREHRRITKYENLPPIVRDAILATEDKHFFSQTILLLRCLNTGSFPPEEKTKRKNENQKSGFQEHLLVIY